MSTALLLRERERKAEIIRQREREDKGEIIRQRKRGIKLSTAFLLSESKDQEQVGSVGIRF